MASIDIVQNKKDILGLEVIFLNEIYLKNSKKYYKLLFRPNFVFEKSDYFDQLFNKHNSIKESIGLDTVELLFYIKTKEGLQKLEIGNKNEPLILKNMIITKTKKGVLTSQGFEFQELLVPESYINWAEDVTITYSMAYKGKCLKEISGKTQGSVLINRRPRIEMRENQIIEQNLISAYLQNDYSRKEKPGFTNILQRKLDLKFLIQTQSRIDFDVDLHFSYKKWNYVNYKILGENANNFIDFFVNGMIDIQNIFTFNEIKTPNIDQYYKLAQIKDGIKYKNNNISITTILKTKFDWQKNIVVEDKNGQSGIVINPLNENGLNYTKKIQFNNLLIVISQDVVNIDYSQNLQSTLVLNFEIKRQYEIEYLRDDLFEINFEDFNEGIKFINEHQKEIS